MRNFTKITTLLLSFSIAASTSAQESNIQFERYGDGCVVKGCNKDIEIADIPSSILFDGSEFPVIGIKESAFSGCHALKEVKLPSSMEVIGEYAFYACDALTSLTIPSSVKAINKGTFWNCTALETISLPESLDLIESKAFYGCKALISIDVPSRVTCICANAFEKCLSLTSVTLPPAITAISDETFFDCYALASINIPESVETIGKNAFSGCHALASVIIPSSVTTIMDGAFYACDALPAVTIPSSVKEIGTSAFWNCTALESVSLSESLETIGRGAFYGCKNLDSLVIPGSLQSIGVRAFEQCVSLKTVILPSSLTLIEDDVFKNCESLAVVVSYPAVAPSVGGNAFYRVPGDAVVYVPAGSLDSYPAAEGWNSFKDFRPIGSVVLALSSSQISMKPEESHTLEVKLEKAPDLDILSETWLSSDPDVAVVKDGVVTAVGEGACTVSLNVIDATGCPHIVSCDVYVNGEAGIYEIPSDIDVPVEYYNLNGVRIDGENLKRGLYIKRQGNRSVKIFVN